MEEKNSRDESLLSGVETEKKKSVQKPAEVPETTDRNVKNTEEQQGEQQPAFRDGFTDVGFIQDVWDAVFAFFKSFWKQVRNRMNSVRAYTASSSLISLPFRMVDKLLPDRLKTPKVKLPVDPFLWDEVGERKRKQSSVKEEQPIQAIPEKKVGIWERIKNLFVKRSPSNQPREPTTTLKDPQTDTGKIEVEPLANTERSIDPFLWSTVDQSKTKTNKTIGSTAETEVRKSFWSTLFSYLKKLMNPFKGADKQKIQKENQTKITEMAKKENKSELPGTQEQPQGREPRFREGMINFKEIEELTGLSKEHLKDRKLLDDLLQGYRTKELVNISARIGDSVVLRGDFRLSLQQDPVGGVKLMLDGVRKEPNFSLPFHEHRFSREDRENLMSETGNMGRTVELWSDQEKKYIESYISRDKLTNALIARPVEDVTIPREVGGVTLNDYERDELRQGRAIVVEGLISEKTGKLYTATLQVNAARGGLDYIFPKRDFSEMQELNRVRFTPAQKKLFQEGRTIFLENMKSRNGNPFSSYVTPNLNTGEIEYTRYNPEVPGEIYIPKVWGGVKLTDQEHETLHKGGYIFLNNMVNSKGREYSSYIKVDLETGRPRYANDPKDFDSPQKFEIPQKVYGYTIKASERAALQDGKVVRIDNLTGYDGVPFTGYLQVDTKRGKLNVTTYDPSQTQGNSTSRKVDTANTAKNTTSRKNTTAKQSQGSGTKQTTTPKQGGTKATTTKKKITL